MIGVETMIEITTLREGEKSCIASMNSLIKEMHTRNEMYLPCDKTWQSLANSYGDFKNKVASTISSSLTVPTFRTTLCFCRKNYITEI